MHLHIKKIKTKDIDKFKILEKRFSDYKDCMFWVTKELVSIFNLIHFYAKARPVPLYDMLEKYTHTIFKILCSLFEEYKLKGFWS